MPLLFGGIDGYKRGHELFDRSATESHWMSQVRLRRLPVRLGQRMTLKKNGQHEDGKGQREKAHTAWHIECSDQRQYKGDQNQNDENAHGFFPLGAFQHPTLTP